jgi:tetratricopeptide (TPR) repeat protein
MALLHSYSGAAHYRHGRFSLAAYHVQRTIQLNEEMGNAIEAAMGRVNRAAVLMFQCKFQEALAESLRALAVLRTSTMEGPRLRGAVGALCAVSEAYRMTGRLSDALRMSRHHLSLAREIGDMHALSIAMGNVGANRLRMDDFRPAEKLLVAARGIKRRLMNRFGYAETTHFLAILRREQNLLHEALELHRTALQGMRELADHHSECEVLNEFAETVRRTGRVDEATEMYRHSLHLAQRGDYPLRMAEAHDGLGRCLDQRDRAEARRHWERALALYRRVDLPQQHDVEVTLRRFEMVPVSAHE